MNDYSSTFRTVAGRNADLDMTAVNAYKNMFGWMAAALALSALTAYICMQSIVNSQYFAELMFGRGMMFALAIASFVLVFVIGGMINRISMTTATLLFALYSVIMGAWITPVLLMYTQTSVISTFVITAGTFGGMALWGHVTNKDLSKVGSICGMALWGLILASIVNIFLKSSMMQFVISYAGVAIFCGLTAWDVQKFKQMIMDNPGSSVGKIALLGALSLYLDFLNLFLYLLRILGSRRD